MTLYHGTFMDFQAIELGKCRPYKDFGKGFYLTDTIYASRVYDLLQDRAADLTADSPAYIYELLKDELTDQ